MTGLDRCSRMMLAALVVMVTLAMAQRGEAQTPQPPAAKPEMMENCPGLIASHVPRAIPAALRLALNPDQVRVTYAGHSTFLIESPQGVRIATDYNDYIRPSVVPDLV